MKNSLEDSMMGEIWLDASTIGDIVDGNHDLATVVRGMGKTLLMVPKVREELTLGNPLKPKLPMRLPSQVIKVEEVFKRLKIQLDTRGSAQLRRELFEKQFKFKKNQTVIRAIEESDAIVLSEVSASASERGFSKPIFITTDKRLANAGDAKLWNVDIRLPDPAALAAAKKEREDIQSKIAAAIDSISATADQLSGEHRLQADVMFKDTSMIGFAGFWTNRLFNIDVPPTMIWNPTFGAVASARRMIREGDAASAFREMLRARAELIRAAIVYRRWKDGIEGAGTKMQILIGAVAVTLVVAAVAAFVATPAVAAASGAGATATATTEATVAIQNLTRLVSQSEAIAVRVATSSGAEAATAMAEYEAALIKAESAVNVLLSL
jgi:hypothetical protein